MISTQILFEANNIPNIWRDRVEVYVLKNNQILVGIHPEIGYHVPGGGVEQGQNLKQAAKLECLEEAGVEIRNIQPVTSDNYYEDWYKLVAQGQPVTGKDRQRMRTYRGIRHHFLRADFVRYDDSLMGSEGDGLQNLQFVSKQKLISEFRKQARNFDPDLYNFRINVIQKL